MPGARITTRVAQIRKMRGVAAADLARRVKVSRQTIYAIESGAFVPNTEVALLLARELEVGVDDLFSLGGTAERPFETVEADVLGAATPVTGQPVRICQIGANWVGVPATHTPLFLPEADGVIKHAGGAKTRAELTVFAKEEAAQKRLLLAGCDPATSLVARLVERISGIEVVTAAASSKLALGWLKQDKVHIAGSHLRDAETGEFNVPYLRREFAGEALTVIAFAHWDEGLVVARGNPKEIRGAADLGRRGVRLINREPGAGSRVLLDRLIGEAGVARNKIQGYGQVAYGHLPAAFQVFSGAADVCIATRSAARAFGLDFIPLQNTRYDLVMRERTAELPAAKAFLDVLNRAALRRKLEVLAGYDTTHTGTMISV